MRTIKKNITAKGKGCKPMAPFYRTSITTPVTFADELNNRRGRESFSGQIVSDMTAYWEAVDIGMVTLRPKFNRNETSLIIEALTAREWKSPKLDRTSLHIMAEAVTDEVLVKKYKVDPKQLTQKIEGLTKIELLALLNWSRTCQQNSQSTKLSVDAFYKE